MTAPFRLLSPILVLLAVLCLPLSALAQGNFPTVFPRSILLLDPDRLLRDSDIGAAMLAAFDEKRAARIAENELIATQLENEESQLTDLRPTIDPEDFRQKARDFDEKVQRIREEQIAKDVELQREADQIPTRFVEISAPFLSELMEKYQSGAIVDIRTVLLYNRNFDVTDEAIELLNRIYAENPDMLTEEEQ